MKTTALLGLCVMLAATAMTPTAAAADTAGVPSVQASFFEETTLKSGTQACAWLTPGSGPCEHGGKKYNFFLDDGWICYGQDAGQIFQVPHPC